MGGLGTAVRRGVIGASRPAGAAGRPAVEITHLRKTYGTLTAVDDVSLSVAEGEIFGLLGPNGAGKTTAIECAIGLREPDAGTIRLLGLDPRADGLCVRPDRGKATFRRRADHLAPAVAWQHVRQGLSLGNAAHV